MIFYLHNFWAISNCARRSQYIPSRGLFNKPFRIRKVVVILAKFFFELGKLYRLWPKPEAKSLMAFGPGNCSMKHFSLDNRLAAIYLDYYDITNAD